MSPLRYVVLHHTGHGEDHFDLMLETSPGSALATWRCPQWPPTDNMPMTPLVDHRREYLTYEGPVSGNRGQVRRVEEGHYLRMNDQRDQWVIEMSSGVGLVLPVRADCASP